MSKKTIVPDQKSTELLIATGSQDVATAHAAQAEFARALQEPLRRGVLSGPILSNIFESTVLAPGAYPEKPLDFLAPGTEKDFVSYTIPNHGRLPERTIEGDYVMVPTYEFGNAIDWLLKYARDARWDVVRRALEVLELGFVKKTNDDGFHTLLTAAADRNIVVFDSDANPGQFTKRLVALMKTIMRRNGGGNSTSMDRGKLTDLYTSPEAIEDMRSWDLSQVDDFTRRKIYEAEDGSLNEIFKVAIHDLDELGEGQEYDNFYRNVLLGQPAPSDVEMVLGLDLVNKDSFWHPIKNEVEIFHDESMHRQRREGYYGWGEHGFAILDARRAILGSF